MGREKKQFQEEPGPSAPLWMVTFSDCMNLLLTFFVLLVTFSSFDTKVLTDLGSVFRKIFPETFPIQRQGELDQSAFLPRSLLTPTDPLAQGSEIPTLIKGGGDKFKKDTRPSGFDVKKVFLIPSKNVFWGKGVTISSDGKKLLWGLALYLKETSSRIVISENNPNEQSDEQLGLQRSWKVVEYLTIEQGVDKRRFNISTSTCLTSDKFISNKLDNSNTKSARILEITILERSLYN